MRQLFLNNIVNKTIMHNPCTLYANQDLEKDLLNLIAKHFRDPEIEIKALSEGKAISFTEKGGFLKRKTQVQFSLRNRNPQEDLKADTSAMAKNLKGLYGYILGISAKSKEAKKSLLDKIDSVFYEIAVLCSDSKSSKLKALLDDLPKEKLALIFSQSNEFTGRGNIPQLLNPDFELHLNSEGHSEIYPDDSLLKEDDDKEQAVPNEDVYPDQIRRKKESIELLSRASIPYINHLPYVESEELVQVRDEKEIAARTVILALLNYVAFGNINNKEALQEIAKYKLEAFVTDNENAFLYNPTESLKTQMTWKCEAIWTLCWALGIVDDLGPADTLVDLNQIEPQSYPFIFEKDPKEFIQKKHALRSKKEILDQNDLYYRYHWACVNAHLNGEEVAALNSGVVYERIYTLNWLIQFMDEDWDDVSCPT
ncbi:DUF4272 domain-containing protein [Croceimicrobium hydrocarbonivorans]|uniref:DUF4272 domain-containing protein n=1 Tax=Croceimicrobium hydrocarbonivorans TaxID=2761580 RepID=A0A7H0VDW0_9FLAO|nr:DUF4272 domain-containing protein [Croceimicrobium hydrocarbonivorans]QNR23908.1 DUF4272 domain-containing protein [Croceimicrobium hydrocarbonivorans]